MTNVIDIESEAQLKNILDSNDNVVIDFWATWCGPCKALAPHYTAAAERLPDVVFVKVDVDELPGIASDYGVRGVPTIIQERGLEQRVIKARAVVPLIRELESDD